MITNILPSYKSLLKSWVEMLKRNNFDDKMIAQNTKDLNRYCGLYEILENNIYICLEYIYYSHSINFVEMLNENITHELIHYILDTEMDININNQNSYGENIHHYILDKLEYNSHVKSDNIIDIDE